MLQLELFLSVGCSPKVYLLDRQTILEEEAAGDWPNFEKILLEKTKAQGPAPFIQTQNSSRRERLYRVLNGQCRGRYLL